MMYYGHGMGMGWSLIVFALMVPVLLLAAGFIGSLLRRQPESPAPRDPSPDAERVLADRLARGDIEAEEYEKRLRVLRATTPR